MGRGLRLSVALELEGEGMTGELLDGAGGSHPFSGWLGLMAAVEAARTAAAAGEKRSPDGGSSDLEASDESQA